MVFSKNSLPLGYRGVFVPGVVHSASLLSTPSSMVSSHARLCLSAYFVPAGSFMADNNDGRCSREGVIGVGVDAVLVVSGGRASVVSVPWG